MKLRIDVEINDDVTDYHFNGKRRAAREYIANELRYSIGLLETATDKHLKRYCKIIADNKGSKEA